MTKNKSGRKPAPVSGMPLRKAPRVPLLDILEQGLRKHRTRVLVLLILSWALLRVSMFNTIANGPLFGMYAWKESDNCFFDEWAHRLAAGDWLNREPMHPYHSWHARFADAYFLQHPDKLNAILAANPGRDSTFVPGKTLWNAWYGGNTYHQEPLYAYLLAALYALTGDGVYWMLIVQALLGIGSGFLLWAITCRYFGETAALLTGVFYLFCGIVLFQEALLLRTAWSVFFALLTVWMFERALERRTGSSFWLFGLSTGLAFLLQAAFLLFPTGALALYGIKARKTPVLLAWHAALAFAGFFVVFSPVMLRNARVGAPVFSTSSVGAVTFVASNVYDTKTTATWAPEAPKCAEIMGKTGGRFSLAAVAALKTHPGVGSYLELLSEKFGLIMSGTEWPNNENYYFYKSMVPALQVAFLNFYGIIWAAVSGLLFALYYRKKCPALYLALSIQLAILLGFYVLGRFRTPLVALCLPFAAYAVVECLRIAQAARQESLVKITLAALCFYLLAYKPYRSDLSMLDPTDYYVFYEIVYNNRVKNYAELQQWSLAIAAHTEFLKGMPVFVRELKPGHVLRYPSHIDIASYFAYHYQLESDLYAYAGNTGMAAQLKSRCIILEQVVENSRKYGRQ